MKYTRVPDPRLKPWILEVGREFGGYWEHLLNGTWAWSEDSMDINIVDYLYHRYLRQWPEVVSANKFRLSSAIARAMREEFIAYLNAIGLTVDVDGNHATINCVAEREFPVRFRGCRRDCLARVGVVYHASEIEEREGVPIYLATIFGKLANAPTGSRSYSGARLALHRDVYIVGRGDCSRVVDILIRSESKFKPIEIQDRIRPTLRKARNTAARVAPFLSEWDGRQNLIRGRKFARLTDLKQKNFVISPPVEVEDVSEEECWNLAQLFP